MVATLKEAQEKWRAKAYANARSWAEGVTSPAAAEKRLRKLVELARTEDPTISIETAARAPIHTGFEMFQTSVRSNVDAYIGRYREGIEAAYKENKWIRGFIAAFKPPT